MCGMHYHRWYRTGEAGEGDYRYSRWKSKPQRLCKVEGCTDSVTADDCCNTHYIRFKRYGTYELPQRAYKNPPCSKTGCPRRSSRRGFCRPHLPEEFRRGKRKRYHYGKADNPYVAIYAPDHPNSWKNGYIPEHVKIMSEILGRSLYTGENVHHKNGVRHDNTRKNLELWVISQPSGQRPEDLVEWARVIIERYACTRRVDLATAS